MADSSRPNFERDVEQAIVALKKGAYLLKYGRRGKPRFCPFRLSTDEKDLIWYAGKEEFKLSLGIVTKIIPGQRTANFHRHPQPDKEYQSFSLIYGHNDQSLDLICRDKEQAELWFVGIKALISGSGQSQRARVDRKNELSVSLDTASSPVAYLHKRPASGSEISSNGLLQQLDYLDTCRPYSYCGSSPHSSLDKYSSVTQSSVEHRNRHCDNTSWGESLHTFDSELGSDSVKDNVLDGFRVSLSSVVSSSSQGSFQDEGDALGDIYMWGEGIGGGVLGGGMRLGNAVDSKMDALVPKHLESAVMIDVQNIACGRMHAALVNKQGEVFCWGEESGGRLGHAINADVPQPKIVEALSCISAARVACGDSHTCAVTTAGDLYTWGNDNNSIGLLGHGNGISHWVPRRISLPQGTRVVAVACGPWHTAFATSSGQLFTFGDGTFGVLGHGDKTSSLVPREVMSLKGLRTIAVACGVWHSAAIVEVTHGTSGVTSPSGKLFTWGDGDKGCLGHGTKDSKLIPTCVTSVVDHEFCQVSCGHSLTVALTTSGQVYTMGSSVYGQLGDPLAKGETPGLVEGKLWEAFVEAIACGAHHVAVLTSRTDIYTWGKGANGRLGHGDVQDRHVPTRVEALKDKHVKSIACGSSFTAAICLHKLLTGADQVMCSGCRMPFVFRRKRHNCYNCGHAFCHTCSSKKVMSAKLAPNPKRPYRVCNTCYVRSKAAIETSSKSSGTIRKRFMLHQSHEISRKNKQEHAGNKLDLSIPKVQHLEGSKILDEKNFARQNKRCEYRRVSPAPINTLASVPSSVVSVSQPNSRIVNALRYTGSLSATPCSSVKSSSVVSLYPMEGINLAVQKMASPIAGGFIGCHGSIITELKGANRLLSEEVMKLQNKLEILKHRCKCQEDEVRRICKEAELGKQVAGEEAAKCKAAKEVIKSLTLQLKEAAKIMPNRLGASNTDENQGDSKARHCKYAMVLSESGVTIDFQSQPMTVSHDAEVIDTSPLSTPNRMLNGLLKYSLHHTKHDGKLLGRQRSKKEWVEQDDPGVYITLISLPNGGNDLKRVRFSRRRFSQTQAEQWWIKNSHRIYEQYGILSS